MSKIAPSGAQGNMRLLKAYGGGSTPPRQSYATGGAVNPSLNEGMEAAAGSDDSPMKSKGKMKDKGKDAKVNINVIVAAKGDKDAPPVPPMGAAGLAPPPPMPPPAPPMMGPGGPPGPGGPGMPMRAKGGAVKAPTTAGMLAEKGFQGGGAGAMGRLEKVKKYGK